MSTCSISLDLLLEEMFCFSAFSIYSSVPQRIIIHSKILWASHIPIIPFASKVQNTTSSASGSQSGSGGNQGNNMDRVYWCHLDDHYFTEILLGSFISAVSHPIVNGNLEAFEEEKVWDPPHLNMSSMDWLLAYTSKDRCKIIHAANNYYHHH